MGKSVQQAVGATLWVRPARKVSENGTCIRRVGVFHNRTRRRLTAVLGSFGVINRRLEFQRRRQGGTAVNAIAAIEGNGDHRVLVLHGWALDSSVWLKARALTDQSRFTYAYVDFPGYGVNRPE